MKSTFSFQFSKNFQIQHPNSVVVYLDMEGSANANQSEEEAIRYRISRVESFGIDLSRFRYEPVVLDVMKLFEMIEKLVEIKKTLEEKIGMEFYILFIVDSISAVPSSKTEDAVDPNKIIGVKARQLSFCLDKYNAVFKFNKITFICIDQIRANIKIEGPYAQVEKSVGSFKDLKTATNIYSLQHYTQQWLFLSKKKQITPDDFGIDGWYVDITTEKNKLASSSHTIRAVFDKHFGIDKFYSEFTFLSEHCPSEEKYFKKTLSSINLPIKQKGAYYYLTIADKNNPENKYTSSTFYIKEAKSKYNSDPIFKSWFDYAVKVSVNDRIINGILKIKVEEQQVEQIENVIDAYVPQDNIIEESIMNTLVEQPIIETSESSYVISHFDHSQDIENPEVTHTEIPI